MLKKKKNRNCLIIAALIIAVGVLVRLHKIDSPLADHQSWRQCDTASMAKNFYLNKTPIISPQIDWGGDSSGVVESEFPLYQYLIGLLYRITGPYDIIGRLFSIILFLLSAITCYLLVEIIFGKYCACFALFFFTFSPLSVYYSRAFMPESLLIFSIFLSLYTLLLWKVKKTKLLLHISALSFALALLVKILILYLIVVLLYIIYNGGDDLKGFIRNAGWFCVIAIIPSILWYGYASVIYHETGLTFGIFSGGYLKFTSVYELTKFSFYNTLFKRLYILIITPFGLIAFIAGLFLKEKNSEKNFLYIWLFLFPVVSFVVAKGFHAHDYYLLPFILPFAIIAGRGLQPLAESGGIVRTAAILIFASAVLFSSYYTLNGDMYLKGGFYTLDKGLLGMSQEINNATSGKDLIVVAGTENVTPIPSLFYLSGRKGWYIEISDINPEIISSLKNKGAKLIASLEIDKLPQNLNVKTEKTPHGGIIKIQ